MSFFTDINDYMETLSSDWSLEEADSHSTVYLVNDDVRKIRIRYYQDMIISNGKLQPRYQGTVDMLGYGLGQYYDVEKIVQDLAEIIKKNI